jgi:hypothetical protein
MKILKNKSKISAITFVLVLTISAILVALPTATAHDPPLTVPTFSYIVVAPNPVGIGQTAWIVFWLDQMPLTAAGSGGDRWRNLEVEVTKPDGSKQMLGPFTSDPVGSGYTSYTPDQVGTYTFDFNFPGQVLSLTGPTGIPGRSSPYENDTFAASSATTTLTVQQDPIPDPITYPLPTEYWTRPIEGQNTAWFRVASNWLSGSHIVERVQPDGTAPNSPHIMWTKPISFGGVVGGSRTRIEGMAYYSGLSYEVKFSDPIIMNGRLYYNLPLGESGSGGGYVCVDLLTGEEIFWQNMSKPSFGQLYDYESMNQHGVIPNGYLWSVPGRGDPPDTPWKAYDPMTGTWLFSLTNVPSGTTVYGPNGEILIYQLDVENKWLALWNNTCEQQGLHGELGTSSGAYQWRPIGKTVDMSQAYSWNVTIPMLPPGATVVKVIHDDLILGRSGILPGVGRSALSWEPYTMWAISLKPETRGQLLWTKEYDAPADNTLQQGWVEPTSRVFTIYYKSTMQWLGYSIDNGSLLWGPTPSEPSWNFYSTPALAEFTSAAYGNLYVAGYSGELRCYNLKNGNLLWTYNNTYAGFENPYGNYPLSIAAIADGKVYLFTSEHSPNAPPYKGVRIRSIDAFTGEEIWTAMGWSSGGAGISWAIADGYMVYLNLYDMQIYCFGKGPSATTVTVQNDILAKGNSVLIKGTVIDVVAGTKQNEQVARFPNGVPAISDEYMTEWMEYLYMQKPIPMELNGVPVKLEIFGEDGSYSELGTVTSNSYGDFVYEWTPPDEGLYTIMATFEGSDSYWSSYDATYLSVGPAAAPSGPIEPEPTEPEEAPFITTEIAIIIAVVVVAVVGIVAYWVLRKRK